MTHLNTQAKYLWASILLEAQNSTAKGHVADCKIILGKQTISLDSISETLQVRSLGLSSVKYESVIAGYLLAISVRKKDLDLQMNSLKAVDLEGNNYSETVMDDVLCFLLQHILVSFFVVW
jgi:hypothetical protein